MANTLNFSAQVSDVVRKHSFLADALIRASVQDVIEDAQTPTAKGGRMRVDTGFLRSSGQISLTGMPSGPTRGEKTEPNSYSPSTENVTATLSGVVAGDTVYYGWTAVYAGPREFHDGFLSGALQKWQAIVDKHCKELSSD